MLLFLSLLAADPATMVRAADLRVSTAATAAAPAPARRSPYRLDPNVAGPADGKAAALGVTGAQCAITGPTLCTHKPRAIFSSSY